MRIKTTILAAGFFLIAGSAEARDERASLEGVCGYEADFAEAAMQGRLDGFSKEEVLQGIPPDDDSESARMAKSVYDKVYAYDISSHSVEAFREKVFQECMEEG
ncbi:hypothetical protein LPL18_002185 [Halomonas sp. CUBES01]|uniref:Uncharacterized protein n=1 Tax=Vreelandella gomseomensis TaxID=370766 RepID=A0ABU1GCV3_9GAMM|nr:MULTISPECIES: hypothetical protein [Halomonas]MDR5875306.1 hypothetical protein [Halomonas gomseomensis]MEC4766144.1 hypothetical protein [Halomonas sp. CUBES01]